MSRVAQMALFAGKIAPAVLAFQGFAFVASAASATATATARAIGTASPGRTVFGLINWDTNSPARSLLSATIGGVAATIHSQSKGDLGGICAGVAIISAQVPTGTTADVVMVFASGGNNYRVYLAVYSCTGLLSQTAKDVSTSYTTGFSNHTDSIDVTKDGILLSAATLLWNTSSSFSGVTRDYNSQIASSSFVAEGGSLSVAADEVNRSVTISVSGSTNAVMCGASFR